MVEVYSPEGVKLYELKKEKLIDGGESPYATINYTYSDDTTAEEPLQWGRVPLIPFKSSDMEIPIITRAKSLQGRDKFNVIRLPEQHGGGQRYDCYGIEEL